MSANAVAQIAIYLVVLSIAALPLGWYMARVYGGSAGFLEKVFGPLEGVFYRVSGIKPGSVMNWKQYALSVLLFNLLGALAVYVIQRLQGDLPQNPMALTAVSPDSSFNTAVSFASNTNWQGYAGESTMSYLTQMLALTVQNFVSASTGMAVLVALIRGLVKRETTDLGNFWRDLVRSTLYILLPLSAVLALVLVSQGTPQTFSSYPTATLVQPVAYDVTESDGSKKSVSTSEQSLAVGPVASQVAIKQLGTNGGGFYNVNSAHPFENPTPLSNFLQMLAILIIPAALCFTFGELVNDRRQGWAVYAVMMIIFVPFLCIGVWAEQSGNPGLAALSVDTHIQSGEEQKREPTRSAAFEADTISPFTHPGGNMEGKETRFGITNSAIWSVATTAASNGSVNAMHDSFTPLGGLVPMFMMQLGEVVFGGVGSGLYGLLIYVILTVFIAGLMVGRTPEYLGKKIEAYEMKMAALIILIPPLVVLIGTAIVLSFDGGRASVFNPSTHGFSEMLYALSSTGNNNGSAFGGISANTFFFNTLSGLAMLISRYWLIIPTLAIAGSLARKKSVPSGPGTLQTHTPLFIGLTVGVVLLVGALSFLPALALGPIVEHLQMTSGK